LFDSLIERLEHSRVYGGNHVHSRIEFLFGHARLPCVRKATIHSRITEPHHRDCKTDEHLFPFSKTFHCVGIAIKGSKISFLQDRPSCD
jgi:hypothetical protein